MVRDPFTLDDPHIEAIGKQLGELYRDVKLSREPMYAWVQIIYDATVLGEQLRRNRRSEAVSQAGDVLTRLLEFVGYYLFVHEMGNAKNRGKATDLADVVAETLRFPSYQEYETRGLKDGPSRWVLIKYPYACAKCGQKQCECVVEPWVLEDRREKPGPYLEKFLTQAVHARMKLSDREHEPFTIRRLIRHFEGIYRAAYYHQDEWKIGMHLSEELGEATTELGRIEVVYNARGGKINLSKELDHVFKIARKRLDVDTKKILDAENRHRRESRLEQELDLLKTRLAKDSWHSLQMLIGERFKEEIADVLSWLSAIIVKLDPQLEQLAETPKKFVGVEAGGLPVIQCPWCHKTTCSDDCLILHDVSGEVMEKVSKF